MASNIAIGMDPLSLAKDIYPIITSPSGRGTFMSREMMDCFTVSGSLYECRWLVFENVTFINQVFLRDLSLGVGIKFVDCRFQGTVTFQNVTSTEEVDTVFDTEKRGIVFERCNFDRRFELCGDRTALERGLFIKGCTFSGGILITDCAVGYIGIQIIDSTITSFFSFKKCTETTFYFRNCKIETVTEIEDCTLQNLTFSQCTLADVCYIQRNAIVNGLSFHRGEFKEEVEIAHNHGSALAFDGTKFLKSVNISHHDFEVVEERKFKSFAVRDCSFSNGFYLTGLNALLPESAVKMNSILINCSALLQGDIYLENLEIGSLVINGLNTKANIVMTNILVDDVSLNDFHNYATFVLNKFRSLGDESRLSWVSTTLGKASLFQVNLASFRYITIKDVVLSEIVTSNVKWFDRKQISVGSVSSAVDACVIKIEFFRQLKYAMEKNSDRRHFLMFHALEMNAYKRYLRYVKRDKLSEKLHLFGDKFILQTSRTNDFGQNWVKATLLLIAFATILYIPIAFCASGKLAFTPARSWADVENTFNVLINELKLWPQLLNPTHNLSTMLDKEVKVSDWIYLFDFFHRIITAYFIFQIVSAFRKYVK